MTTPSDTTKKYFIRAALFMEIYAKAPHVPAATVYPLVRIAFGSVSPFIRTSH